MTTSEHTELLPCPFCGSEAEIERRGDHRVSTVYRCTSCGCSLETGEEWSHGRGWNRRAIPDGAEPVPVAWQFEKALIAIVQAWHNATTGKPNAERDLGWTGATDNWGQIFAWYAEKVLFASPTGMGVTEGAVTAPEIANEIWEVLFNETKDCVPEGLTDELLAKVAEALLSGYSLQRRARHG